MTPLEIKECDVAGITFKEGTSSITCFRKGCVTVSNPAQETFLDVSGLSLIHICTYKPNGLNRTYPNVINYEAVHGLEQMKWSDIHTDQVTYRCV